MTQKQAYDHEFKILILGNSGVGKSCIMLQAAEKKYTPYFLNTIGVDFKFKYVEVEGQRVKLAMWDTAGQDRFRTITTSYYRNSNCMLIVYDVTDRTSFEGVANWYEEMRKNVDDKSPISCILVGNKVDMTSQRVVTSQQGEHLGTVYSRFRYSSLNKARKYNIRFMETSAKTGQNVDNVFEELTRDTLHRNYGSKERTRPRPPLPMLKNQEQYCKCCEN